VEVSEKISEQRLIFQVADQARWTQICQVSNLDT